MAPLRDPDILAQYKSVLSNWQYRGYIDWKDSARQWIEKNLRPINPREIGRLMHLHIEAGGQVDQVPERRPEWSCYDYHYDLRLRVGERLIYVETVLVTDNPKDPTIAVVSIHDV